MSPKQEYQNIAHQLYEHTRKDLSSYSYHTQIVPRQRNPMIYVKANIEIRLECDDRQCEISLYLLSEQRAYQHLQFGIKMFTARILPLEVVAQMSLFDWEAICCEMMNKFNSYY